MFGQELKRMGIATAYRYIEKNPKDNLRKLMTWVDRIAGEGPDSFEEQRKVIWDILDHPESNMYQLIMRVIEEVDPEVVKTVFKLLLKCSYSWMAKTGEVKELNIIAIFRGLFFSIQHLLVICIVQDVGLLSTAIS